LRTVSVREIDPLVQMPGNDKLDRIAVFTEDWMQSIIRNSTASTAMSG